MDIKDKVAQRVKETEQKRTTEVKSLQECLSPAFIAKCLKQNSFGDSEIFKKLFEENFCFNKSMDCWMFWAGHHWEIDKMGYALASVESVAKVYENESLRLLAKIKEANADE